MNPGSPAGPLSKPKTRMPTPDSLAIAAASRSRASKPEPPATPNSIAEIAPTPSFVARLAA